MRFGLLLINWHAYIIPEIDLAFFHINELT